MSCISASFKQKNDFQSNRWFRARSEKQGFFPREPVPPWAQSSSQSCKLFVRALITFHRQCCNLSHRTHSGWFTKHRKSQAGCLDRAEERVHVARVDRVQLCQRRRQMLRHSPISTTIHILVYQTSHSSHFETYWLRTRQWIEGGRQPKTTLWV